MASERVVNAADVCSAPFIWQVPRDVTWRWQGQIAGIGTYLGSSYRSSEGLDRRIKAARGGPREGADAFRWPVSAPRHAHRAVGSLTSLPGSGGTAGCAFHCRSQGTRVGPVLRNACLVPAVL